MTVSVMCLAWDMAPGPFLAHMPCASSEKQWTGETVGYMAPSRVVGVNCRGDEFVHDIDLPVDQP